MLSLVCNVLTFWLCHLERREAQEFAARVLRYDGIEVPPRPVTDEDFAALPIIDPPVYDGTPDAEYDGQDTYQCCYCRQRITLIDGRGWVHVVSDTDRCWPDNPRDLTEAEPLVSDGSQDA